MSYFDEFFSPAGGDSLTTDSSNKKLQLAFRKTKLGNQSLYYVEPNA